MTITPLRRPANSIVIIGDSYTNFNSPPQGSVDTSNTSYNSTLGYWSWADVFLRKRLKLLAVKGVGGQTGPQIGARIAADVLSMNPRPGYCLFQTGANDGMTGLPAGLTVAAMRQAADTLIKAGIVPIFTAPPPTNGYYSPAALARNFADLLRLQRDFAQSQPGAIYVNWRPYVCDPVTGNWLSGCTTDGIHPNAKGAALLGKALSDALTPLIPAVDSLICDGADVRSVNVNPTMTTTQGTGTVGTGVTGSVPYAFGVAQYSTASTIAVSQVARAGGISTPWTQLDITSGDAQLYCFAAAGTFPVGRPLFAECEFEVDSSVSLGATKFELTLTYSSAGQQAKDLSISSADVGWAQNWMSGVFRTPVTTVPVAATNVKCIFNINGTGRFRVGRMSIRADD